MDFSDSRSKIFLGIVVVLVLGIFYFLWTRSASPDVTIPPGQSISNPMGGKESSRERGPAARARGVPGQ
jgi:hypothetical protein